MKAEISFKRATTEDKGFLLELRKLSMGQHLAAAGINLSDDEHLQRINEFFKSHLLFNIMAKVLVWLS